MLLILGTAMLIAASLMLIAGHLVLNRPSAPREQNAFGAGELIAFTVTALVAGGISSLAGRLLSDWRPMVMLETGAAVVLVIAGTVAVWALLRRKGAAASDTPRLHSVDRRDRRGPGDRPQSPGSTKNIRAVR